VTEVLCARIAGDHVLADQGLLGEDPVLTEDIDHFLFFASYNMEKVRHRVSPSKLHYLNITSSNQEPKHSVSLKSPEGSNSSVELINQERRSA
jgi:hypothetical protein